MSVQHLPSPRGPITESLFTRLRTGWGYLDGLVPAAIGTDVLTDEDVQLALHVIYELSYRGYAEVDAAMECDERVVALKRRIEVAMEAQLREQIGPVRPDVRELLAELSSDSSGPSLSATLLAHPRRDVVAEFAIHRSAYQLKEADPHSWAIPRLGGRAKAALVEIQFDEYGRGEPGRSHAELFAATMTSLGLDATYGTYIDRLPATTLATGNLIGLLGQQRRLLPALLGHLALFEMTSTGPMSRYVELLERVGVDEAGREFFAVHVIADAHHEVIALTDLVGGYLEQDPGAGAEIGFGAMALTLVEGAFSSAFMAALERGESTLRPLPAQPVPQHLPAFV